MISCVSIIKPGTVFGNWIERITLKDCVSNYKSYNNYETEIIKNNGNSSIIVLLM